MEQKEAEKPFSKHYALYTYDISHLKGSNKVRFVYVLKGRGKVNKGLIEEMRGKFLVPGCFIVPIGKDQEVNEIMQKWNVSFKRMEVLTH